MLCKGSSTRATGEAATGSGSCSDRCPCCSATSTGALASFDWCVDAFPDDGGEPYQYLTWALAIFRGGRRPEAVHTLCHTMLQNVCLVPFVLGHHPRRLDIWHANNWEWPEYAADVPKALLNSWDDVALQ